MNPLRSADAAADAGQVSTPTFTLGSALEWLGHHCATFCSAPLDSLSASIWFLRQSTRHPGPANSTLIALDLTDYVGPPAHLRRLLRDVNGCVAADHIRVVPRPSADNGRALAALARDPDSHTRFHYHLVAAARPDYHLLSAAQLDPAAGEDSPTTARGSVGNESRPPANLEEKLHTCEREIENLQAALQNARRIGQAVGILMAIYTIGSDQAFTRLSKASQDLNRKLRDVAADVILTGALPDE